MSLKDKFLEKKLEKQDKNVQKLAKTIIIGKPKTGKTKSEQMAIRKMRENNRLKLWDGQAHTKEEIAEIQAENAKALENIKQGIDLIESIGNFEKMARNLTVFAKLFESKKLLQVCQKAQDALKQTPIDIIPLAALDEWCQVFLRELITQESAETVSEYCTSVQIAEKTIDYYKRPIALIEALKLIANGASLRSLAQKFKQSESSLRAEILETAQDLYYIAECIMVIRPPKTIPELREKTWKMATDSDFLYEYCEKSKNFWLLPFEHKTGITLINHEKFVKDIMSIEHQHHANLL